MSTYQSKYGYKIDANIIFQEACCCASSGFDQDLTADNRLYWLKEAATYDLDNPGRFHSNGEIP